MDVSISEVSQFLRCRRQWDIASMNRQGLRPIALPRPILSAGTFIHAGLNALSKGEPVITAITNEYENEKTRFTEAYIKAVGVSPDTTEIDTLTQMYDNAILVVGRYINTYGVNPVAPKYEIMNTEQTFRVPIPGTEHFLIGTFDRIMEGRTGEFFVGEIKTFDRRPNFEDLQNRPQFSGYAWALSLLTGTPIGGVLYDGINRKLPKAPAILKNGSVSKAWSDTLDYQLYVDAIQRSGGQLFEYEEILTRIIERDNSGNNPFFVRFFVPISESQRTSFEEQLVSIVKDMEQAVVYPNFQMTCAWDCNVRNLCAAMQNKEDVQSIIDTSYRKAEGNVSFQNQNEREVEFGLVSE